MQQVLGGLSLFVMVLALWMRRSSLRHRWEGGPTLIVLSAIGATMFMSRAGSVAIGRPLHALTGMWNLEDFIGHVLALICAATLAYVVMARFNADDETLGEEFHALVGIPLTFLIPLLFALFLQSKGSREYATNFYDVGGDFGEYLYLEGYWMLLTVALAYILGWSIRHLWVLRRDEPSPVVTLYLATATLTLAFFTALTVHAVTSLRVGNFAWHLGYLCVIGWTGTPAVAWRRRVASLQ